MKGNQFTGTGSLVRLALRQDRVRLPLWVLGISLFLWVAVGVNDHFSAEEMVAIVMLAAENPAMRMLLSPIMAESVTEVSRFVFFRFSFVFCILTVLMSIQLVTRHTRRNEDTGCAEMIGSSVTGRYAPLAAAITVGAAANLALAVLMGVALIAHGLPVAGSFAAGASFGGLGLVFTGIAAVAAQLAGTSGGANGVAGMAFGAAFAVNGAANALGPINRGGMGFRSSALAWLSPMGWTQRFYPFDEASWWILALFGAFFVVLVLLAFPLVDRRDLGRGVLADRRGRETARRWLLSPVGVAWRLQRGTLASWAVPVAFMGAMLGASAQSLGETMGGTEFFGGAFSDAVAEFPFLVVGIAAMAASVYLMRSLLRMRTEEDGGPLENLLSTPVRRSAFVASHAVCGLAGSIGLVVLFALAQALAMGSAAGSVAELAAAAMIQSVGVVVLGGFVLAAYGLIPKAARVVSLTAVIIAMAAGPFFGTALDLPDQVMKISPFTHLEFMPQSVSGTNVAVLLAIGMVLGAAGFVSFARRDLHAR